MLVNQLKKGESATIVKINAEKALTDRLNSFGIVPGEEIILMHYSLAKQTIEVSVGSTHIVLRTNEAEQIEVTKEEKEK